MTSRAVVLTELEELERLKPDWWQLLERSNSNHFALSPTWLLTWWRVFGSSGGRRLRVVAVYGEGRLIGLWPLQKRTRFHRGLIPLRRLEFIGSGEPEADEVCSEYMDVITERGREQCVIRALRQLLSCGGLGDWDEMNWQTYTAESTVLSALMRSLEVQGTLTDNDRRVGCPYAHLEGGWAGYLDRLNGSRRHRLRRSLRKFDDWARGNSRLYTANTAAELSQGLHILRDLHQARWAATGRAGAFASGKFAAFHGQVLPELLAREHLLLQWLEVRGEPVAAVYNIAWKKKVCFYLGGRKPDLPGYIQPGIALHAHSIRHAMGLGYSEYDFLGGVSRYKESLSHDKHWLRSTRLAPLRWAERSRAILELMLKPARKLRSEVVN